MSYINQALNKAQEAKEGRYKQYRRFIETAGAPPRPLSYSAWVILGLALVALIAVIFLTVTAPWISPTGEKRPPDLAIKKTPPSPPPPGPETARKEVAPVSGEDLFPQATAAQKLRDFDEAERLYRLILEARPNHRESLNNLGLLFLERGNYTSARKYLERAMAANPAWVYPLYNLACLLGRQERPNEALVFLKRAATLTPQALQWAAVEDDLTAVRTLPEYKKLLEDLAQ